MKKLYELEIELNNERKKRIDKVKYEELTLKQVLDLGFNNVWVKDIGIYKDDENKYVFHSGYYLTSRKLLSAKVKYKSFFYSYPYGDNRNAIEIRVDFIDKTLYELLKKRYKEEK